MFSIVEVDRESDEISKYGLKRKLEDKSSKNKTLLSETRHTRQSTWHLLSSDQLLTYSQSTYVLIPTVSCRARQDNERIFKGHESSDSSVE